MIKLNSIQCKKCGIILISKEENEWLTCDCRQLAIHGGIKSIGRTFFGTDPQYIELSNYDDT